MGTGIPSFTTRNVFRVFVVLLGLVSIASAANNGLLQGRRQRMHDVLKNLSTNSRGGSNSKAKPDAAKRRPVTDVNGTVIPDYDVIYTFDQLIDHSNPKLGTFKQRYYHTWEYWRPGGPIVVTTPGEQAMDGEQAPSVTRPVVAEPRPRLGIASHEPDYGRNHCTGYERRGNRLGASFLWPVKSSPRHER